MIIFDKKCSKMGLDLLHVKPSTTKVNDSDYLRTEEFDINQSFLKDYVQLIKIIKDEFGNEIQILYFVEKGYQRKGMKKEFFDVFQNDKLYFKISDVQNAKMYIDSSYDLDDNLFESFQQNFINNFWC